MSTRDEPEPAVLSGELGAFRFSVLRYQIDKPDDDLDWLVTRLAWGGKSVRIDHTGPDLTASELRLWTDKLRRIAEEPPERKTEFIFMEPNFVMSCQKSSPRDKFTISLEIHGEPAMTGEHFSVEFEVDRSELRRFAKSLSAWCDRFPHRGERPGIPPVFATD